MIENPMYLADPEDPMPCITFELIGAPTVQPEYSDEWSTTMVCDVRWDETGLTGDVWIVAGVPGSLQGTSTAACTQRGYERVWLFGDSLDQWCPPCFLEAIERCPEVLSRMIDEIVRACEPAAIKAHRREKEGLK